MNNLILLNTSAFSLNNYVMLSFVLFAIGIVGVMTRRNAIVIFMCIEIMLNSVNFLLVDFPKTRR
jgi:NADH-quinone oxidoreductase subunit K